MTDASTTARSSWLTPRAPRSFSDLILTGGVVAIIGLMILPMPTLVVDVLVAANVLFAVGLLLLAIYIPGPVAFASFPSVLLLTTLFRLSLAIAITRLILLQADAGSIIQTFGMMVVGGNLVVGFVVFLIITVVQFIVIAKGAERVAEVAARFTLDAMPGKQLSIDSDLRSGLIDKDEARRKRRHLEVESQLHGALDGAMKFVKGDSIAGIVIIVINILGGLAVGVMQRGLSLQEAVQTYSILTIGDGLVGQIPALLSAIAAGLIVTRTAGDDDEHLGTAITREIGAQPRVALVGGLLALLLALVPGFPWPVFLAFGVLLTGGSIMRGRRERAAAGNLLTHTGGKGAGQLKPVSLSDAAANPLPAVMLDVGRDVITIVGFEKLTAAAMRAAHRMREEFGAPVADPIVQIAPDLQPKQYRLSAYGVCIAQGELGGAPSEKRIGRTPAAPQLSKPPGGLAAARPGDAKGDPATSLEGIVASAFRRQLGKFLGIQETANLLTKWSRDYPDLIKEMLRTVPPGRIAEILRLLLNEGVPIRHMRDVLEAITEANSKDREVGVVTDYVRIGLGRHITQRYIGKDNVISAMIAHPELEDTIRQAAARAVGQVAVDAKLLQRVIAEIREILAQADAAAGNVVMLCSVDVRRHLRKLTETEFFELPVLSFQELTPDISVVPVGQVRG